MRYDAMWMVKSLWCRGCQVFLLNPVQPRSPNTSRWDMQCAEAGVAIAQRRRVERTHTSREEGELPEIDIDYGFFGRGGEDVLPILCVQCRNSSTGCLGATVVDRKGASDNASSFLTAFIKSLGFKRILVRSDTERSLLSLIERMMNNLMGVESVQMTSPEGDHAANGLVEVGVREIKAQTRILRSQLEQRRSVDVVDTTSRSKLCVHIQTDGRWSFV